jgi:NAD-dependent SIR2 family protein deacetylase
MPRSAMQALLAGRNPDMAAAPSDPRPDGDAILDPGLEDGFQVPGCPGCGGVLKPGVVFFGENVPRPRVERALQRLRQSDALLVAGSSLSVYSGFRFCREAVSRGIPIALVNRGRTRADALAALKLDAEVGDTLSSLARLVGGTPAS